MRHKECEIVRGIKVFYCPYCGKKVHNYANGIDICEKCSVEFNICQICGKELVKPFHLSWLETAITNFKNSGEVKAIRGDMTLKEFIEKYAENELNQCIEVE